MGSDIGSLSASIVIGECGFTVQRQLAPMLMRGELGREWAGIELDFGLMGGGDRPRHHPGLFFLAVSHCLRVVYGAASHEVVVKSSLSRALGATGCSKNT